MMDTTETPMTRVLRFLDRLEQAKIAYRLEHVRDSIMVVATVPGERWEIEFMEDGDVEVERFTTSGVSADAALLDQLISTHGASVADEEPDELLAEVADMAAAR
jgi:hypothetical protein